MSRWTEWIKLAKYALVGGMNTGVDFGVFCALVYGVGAASAWAQPISYGAGLLNSYFLNRKWTFKATGDRHLGDAVRFVVVNAVSFGAATGTLLALEAAGWEPVLAKCGSVFVALAVNYAGYRLWVFRLQSSEERANER